MIVDMQRGAAGKLRHLFPDILARWEDRVRAAVPAAVAQDRLLLFDEIPLFLARVAQALDGTLVGEAGVLSDDVGKEHGTQRANETDYPLGAVVLEYRILRRTICEVLAAAGPLLVEEREIITECIEMAIQEAIEQFAAIQRDQALKHTLVLERADRLKNEFVATLAHELRTPLSAISNAAFILESVQLDDRSIRQIGTVARQARHLTRLVDDLMDVARIVRGGIELRYETVSVCRAARDAEQTIRPFTEARGQDLILSIPDDDILIDADPARLQQIITNLLNNATKYTEPGGKIWFTVSREGDDAVVRVKDTGIGIEPIMLPQIFDLFAQVDPASARSHGGLGIGLSLVRKLVQMHGGTIEVKSAGPDTGTEFIVRFSPGAAGAKSDTGGIL